MPLDTGAFVETTGGDEPLARRPRLVLDSDIAIGSALKAAREGLGLSLDEIAEITKVRARHLAAIEDAALDQLPSRPFTVGYVRAYAKALGLDADATAARFRTEYPSPDDDELRSPAGVRHNRAGRSGALITVGAVAIVAVVGWNIVLHATAVPAHKRGPVPHVVVAPRTNAAVDGPFSLNAPLPAPPEATAPAPYVTPVVGANAPANAINPPAGAVSASNAPATPFVAAGQIFGPSAGASDLIIQAKKSISLEVRGPGGVVYFARQLAA